MISDLRNANAGMIAFTIMFPEPDRFGGDEVFASWINGNGIVLSQQADSRGRSDAAPYVGTATLGEGDAYDFVPKYEGLITNIPDLETQAWGVGLVNGKSEVDNITRRIPLLSQVNGQLYPSMALEIIRVLQDKKSLGPTITLFFLESRAITYNILLLSSIPFLPPIPIPFLCPIVKSLSLIHI